NDNVASEVGARMNLGRDQRGLACMTGVALFDRNDVEQPAAAGFMTPYTLDVRHAGFFDLIPDQSRFNHTFRQRIIRRGTPGASPRQYRIHAMVNMLDANNRLRTGRTRIIPGPLPEWSLFHDIARCHDPFDHNLRLGRHWQTGGLPFDHFNWT